MSVSPWLVALKETLHMQGTPVIEFGDSSEVSEILSAANLWTRALERKRILAAKGFKTGDILCESSVNHDLLINFIACNMLGGCFFPLKKSDFEELLTNESSDLPVYMWRNQDLVTCHFTGSRSTALVTAAQDSILLLQTSGTTGTPKFVGLSGDAILHQVRSLISALDLQPEQVRLIVLPLHHCFGLILDLLVGLFSRQTIFIRSHLKFEASMVFDLIRKQQIRHLSLVPRMVELLLEHAERNSETHLLKSLQVHVGGATISNSFQKKATKIFSGWIEGYGLTECAGGVLINGKPNNCEVKLKPLTDSQGIEFFELWVKSPSLGQFENQNALDAEGFFNTGDLATLTLDQGIHVLNRAGQLIKTQKGLWVTLDSIQNKIQQEMHIELIWICRQGHEIRVAITPDDELKMGQIKDFLASRIGVDVQIVLIQKSYLQRILSESPKKSGHEAVSEWVFKNPIAYNTTQIPCIAT